MNASIQKRMSLLLRQDRHWLDHSSSLWILCRNILLTTERGLLGDMGALRSASFCFTKKVHIPSRYTIKQKAMILQSWNTHFCLSRTMSVLQIQRIFMAKRGKLSSGIWKAIHISFLTTVRRWKQIYSSQNKSKAQNLQDRGKKESTSGWWLTNSCWFQGI